MKDGIAAAMAALILGLVPFCAHAEEVCSAAPPGLDVCTENSQHNESRDIQCTISAKTLSRRRCLMAFFSGSHDDTMASMMATLNGKPLQCEPGSKVELMGEDGEVMLHCVFLPEPSGPDNLSLRATIAWRHAQYTGFALGLAGAESAMTQPNR